MTGEANPPVAPAYDAASVGRRLRMWRTAGFGPKAVVANNATTLRNRARSAVRNDPWAGTAADRLVANMVGTGIQAKSRNGTDVQKAQIKALWDLQCAVMDADGVLDFYGQQALVAREWAGEVGECFARIRRRRLSDGLPVPLQVQLIEAEQVPITWTTTARNGNRVEQGIEFDALGRRVAYWMYREHPGDNSLLVNGSELVRVPADEIIHVFEPLRAGQIRGVPYAASALPRMYHLDTFSDNVLDRMKIANLFTAFLQTKGGEPDAPTPVVSELQTDVSTEGVALGGLEPGTTVELPPGVEAKFSDPPDAGENYLDFLRGHLMAIAARFGVPYEVLTGDLKDVSDRALRLILNEFRRLIEMRQWLYLIPQFCQRVRVAFLDAAVLSGALSLPGYDTRRGEYIDTLWVPQGWPYSHPVQDVDADIKAIDRGLTSRSAVVLGKGDDPEEVDRQNAADRAREQHHKLRYTSGGKSGVNASADSADQTER